MADRANLVNWALIVSALTTVVLCIVMIVLLIDASNQRLASRNRQQAIICILKIMPEDRTEETVGRCTSNLSGV